MTARRQPHPRTLVPEILRGVVDIMLASIIRRDWPTRANNLRTLEVARPSRVTSSIFCPQLQMKAEKWSLKPHLIILYIL